MPFSLFRLRFAKREHRMQNNIFKACTLINERRAQHYRPAEALLSPTTHTYTHTHSAILTHRYSQAAAYLCSLRLEVGNKQRVYVCDTNILAYFYYTYTAQAVCASVCVCVFVCRQAHCWIYENSVSVVDERGRQGGGYGKTLAPNRV